ncbi:MAG: hypothetical protein K6B65_03915 [Bacilli bacterium]|nr:hypothetical protein [Bacilli bacterium]
MKRIQGYLVLLPIVFASASCGNGVDWGSIEAYKEASELSSTFVESGNRLVINIDNDGYLNNVSKDKVIVQSRESLSKIDLGGAKELSADALKKSAIPDFALEVGKDIKVTIDNYVDTTYVVIFNKVVTKDGKFAFAAVDLVEDVYVDQPYVSAIDAIYYQGDVNPVFLFDTNLLSVADGAKVTFSESLAGLTFDKCEAKDDVYCLYSKGTISSHGNGYLTLKAGFFKEIDYDIDLFYTVETPSYWIDESSFALENGQFSFVIHFDAVKDTFMTNGELSIGSYTSSKVDFLSEEGTSLKVTIPFKGTKEEAIAALSGKSVSFSSEILNALFGDMTFFANDPFYEVDAELLGKSLTIEFYYRNAITDPIPFEAISLVSPQLELEEGDILPAEKCTYEQTMDGFRLTIATEEIHDFVSGTIIISGEGRFKTLWGSIEKSPSVAFECSQTKDTAKGEYDESYCEKVINATPGIDEFSKLMTFSLLIAEYGISQGTGNPLGVITSLLGLMNLFGFSGNSSSPSIQDVLDKLKDISNQLKVIDRKIDALNRQMQDARIATEVGLTKVLFNQYHGAWESFYNANIRPAEDLIRDYTADMRSYLIKFVWNTEPVTYNLKYYDLNDKTYIGIENPNRAGYTLEGYTITSNKSVTIEKSHFKDVADKASRAQGYYSDFDIDFRKCLNDSLKASYSSLSEDQLKALSEDVYAHIQAQAQFSSVSDERAQSMVNLFLNYASGITDSKLDNLFRMLECLYNFESEAKAEIKQFRTQMKILLDKYAGLATTMSQFCPGIAKQDITTAYQNAAKRIRDVTYLQKIGNDEIYCYPTHSKITTRLIKAGFNTYFTNVDTNDATFHSDFAFQDVNTLKIVPVTSLNALLTETDLNIIYARILNAIRTKGQSVTAVDFYKYLKENKLITDALVSNNKIKYEGKDVVVSYGGINDLSSTSFLTRCVAHGSGDYFAVDRNYEYGTIHGSKWWSGREATGGVYNLDSRTITDNAIERFARYDQSHWYWSTDEHWSYESVFNDKVGRIAFMFFKG